MLADLPAALADEPEATSAGIGSAAAWVETALTALFAVTAVVFISFLAVITNL
jgi:hypothetical protein